MAGNEKMKVLLRLYGNHKLQCGLSSARKLYNEARKHVSNLTYGDVRTFLSSQDSYTLHKQGRKNFPRRKIVVSRPGVIASVDLADMSLLKEQNDGVRYLLFILDSFSRYLIIKPLRDKSGASVLQAFKGVFENVGEGFASVKRVFCDKGREWYNIKVASYLKSKRIRLYSVQNQETKAALVERCIRTIKQKIYKYLTHNSTLRYINVLEGVVAGYNTSEHRSLKNRTPSQIHFTTNENLVRELFIYNYIKPCSSKKAFSFDLKVDDTVRVSKYRETLGHKGFVKQNSEEIFRIYRIKEVPHYGKIYFLKDLRNDVIEGSFYGYELVKTKLPEIFKVSRIIRRRVNSKTKQREVLVEWEGYSDDFNEWIPEKNLVQP